MTIAEEAQRYLAVVDAFRAEGCEPDWRPETWVERVWLNDTSAAVCPEPDERRKQCSS
jgi:hypothetical protein